MVHRPAVGEENFERVIDAGRAGESFDAALGRLLLRVPSGPVAPDGGTGLGPDVSVAVENDGLVHIEDQRWPLCKTVRRRVAIDRIERSEVAERATECPLCHLIDNRGLTVDELDRCPECGFDPEQVAPPQWNGLDEDQRDERIRRVLQTHIFESHEEEV